MNGRTKPLLRWSLVLLCAAAVVGCEGSTLPPHLPVAPLADAGADFVPVTAGDVTGTVTWAGDLPSVPPFVAPSSPLSEPDRGPRRPWPNPHAPRIDPLSRAVGNAVVFLRGVNPRKARRWPHDPVRVEVRDYGIHVLQGDGDGPYGFVRRGDAVEWTSRQPGFISLQARGAAFFSLPFPAAGSPRSRPLERNGVVELSSGAGQFWMRAYLFADDHPYYARTGTDGSYSLRQAPPGDYDLVCWLPDWRERSHELDADTWQVTRLTFRPPLQIVRRIHIDPAKKTTADFTVSLKAFEPFSR